MILPILRRDRSIGFVLRFNARFNFLVPYTRQFALNSFMTAFSISVSGSFGFFW